MALPQGSPERDQALKAHRKQTQLALLRSHRPPNAIIRENGGKTGGLLGSPVGTFAQGMASGGSGKRTLRINQSDVDAGRADIADLGKFWFVDDFSDPAGDDVPRP
jgi:hypothetical protein